MIGRKVNTGGSATLTVVHQYPREFHGSELHRSSRLENVTQESESRELPTGRQILTESATTTVGKRTMTGAFHVTESEMTRHDDRRGYGGGPRGQLLENRATESMEYGFRLVTTSPATTSSTTSYGAPRNSCSRN